MDGCGRIAVPSDTTNVWMSEMELVELFDVLLILVPFGHTVLGSDASGQPLHVLVHFLMSKA